MKKNLSNRSWYLIVLLSLAPVLNGCSSSGVDQNSSEVPPDELPMIDAETDALPAAIEEPSPDEISADSLQAEAPTDLPTAPVEDPNAMPSSEPVADAPVQTEPEMAAPAPESLAEAPVAPLTEPEAVETPVAAEPETSSTNTGGFTYRVRPGDTLMKVAYLVYGDVYLWKKVLDDNIDRISNPNRLEKGTELRVDQEAQHDDYSGFEKYLIQHGDTLGTISSGLYGTKKRWKALWKWNDKLIKDPNRIYAGFFIRYVPSDQAPQNTMEPAPLSDLTDQSQERLPTSNTADSSVPPPAETASPEAVEGQTTTQ